MFRRRSEKFVHGGKVSTSQKSTYRRFRLSSRLVCVGTGTQPRTTCPRLEAPAVQAATQYTEPCRLPGRIRGRTKLPENLRRSSIRYALFGVAHESPRDAGLSRPPSDHRPRSSDPFANLSNHQNSLSPSLHLSFPIRQRPAISCQRLINFVGLVSFANHLRATLPRSRSSRRVFLSLPRKESMLSLCRNALIHRPRFRSCLHFSPRILRRRTRPFRAELTGVRAVSRVRAVRDDRLRLSRGIRKYRSLATGHASAITGDQTFFVLSAMFAKPLVSLI